MTEPTGTPGDLARLHRERDRLLLSLWLVMRDLSDYHDEHEMSEEDLAAWGTATKHSAIQGRLASNPQPPKL